MARSFSASSYRTNTRNDGFQSQYHVRHAGRRYRLAHVETTLVPPCVRNSTKCTQLECLDYVMPTSNTRVSVPRTKLCMRWKTHDSTQSLTKSVCTGLAAPIDYRLPGRGPRRGDRTERGENLGGQCFPGSGMERIESNVEHSAKDYPR